MRSKIQSCQAVFRRLTTLFALSALVLSCGAMPARGGAGEVTYHDQTRGYLALPEGAGKHPAVVMIHEWWGLNPQIKREADRLATSGYVVLAVDLMKGAVATTPDEAMAQVKAVQPEEALANLKGAVSYLRGRPDVRADRIASLGWCFGGGYSLQLLLAQKDLAAGVMYYGTPVTDVKTLQGMPPLLGIFGEDDTSIPVARVHAFDEALSSAKVPHAIHIYAGAGHAFANPTGGDRYRPEAAKDAWDKTLAFLKEHLQ